MVKSLFFSFGLLHFSENALKTIGFENQQFVMSQSANR